MSAPMSGACKAALMATSCSPRPGIELVSVDSETIRKAEGYVESCEHCDPDDAEIPFDWFLAEVTGKHGPYEFILTEPARCPNCKQHITEKTLVDRRD